MKRGVVFAIAFASLAAAPRARAERALEYDLRLDLPITLGGGALLVLSETTLKPALAPRACRWCDPGGLDWSIRQSVVWARPRAAAATSDVIGLGLAPVSALGLTAIASSHDRAIEGFPLDALIILESSVLALGANQITKMAVGRQRPYARADALEGTIDDGADDNLSFFSGHTSLGFALATASGTVASMRGYRLAPLVWASGMTLATSTAYLRMAADKHYFTDVVVGALVGAGVGFAVPYFFHGPRAQSDASTAGAPLAAPLEPTRVPAFTIGGVW